MPAPEFLSVPPVEAVESFRAKGFHVGFDWRDTSAAEHARSFTVAKAMRLDILADIRQAVDEALAEGTTFEAFRERLEPLLQRKGWWGRQRTVDPATGAERVVQLGSPRRLRIVFDTNLRMSYARGRWERIERVAEARPWLRYVSVLDAETRPEHAAWHGTVLRWDDPWWETHYPPNGWRCRCTVVQLSDDDLKEFGYAPSSGPPPGSEKTRHWRNRRTGETAEVPVGIDPGFQHNAGTVSRAAFVDPPEVAAKIAAQEDALAIPAFLKRDPAPGGVRAGLAEDSVTAAEFRRRAPGYTPPEALPGRAREYYRGGHVDAEINAALRAGREPASERAREVAADMTAAMKPLREDMTLWRGLADPRDLKVGQIWDNDGFMSTSASWRTSQHFAGENGTLFKIRAPKGAAAVVENEIEQEVTFKPGRRLRVVEVVDGARNGAHRGYAGPDRVYIMELLVEDGD